MEIPMIPPPITRKSVVEVMKLSFQGGGAR
jgi:hypothetical protein